MKFLGEVFKKGVGLSALVLALAAADDSYSAGPAKASKPAQNRPPAVSTTPYPTPTAVETTKDLSMYTGMMGAYPQLANAHHVNTHKLGKDMWLVFMSNKDRILGIYDLTSNELMNRKEITATPRAAPPTLTPTSVPTKDPALSLDTDTYTSTPVNTLATTPTQYATVSGSATPKTNVSVTPTPKPNVPINISGKLRVGIGNENVSGTDGMGTDWNDKYARKPSIQVENLGIKALDYGPHGWHGGLFLDALHNSGSISGSDSGSYSDGEYVARLLLGGRNTFSNGLTFFGDVGPAYGIKTNNFTFPQGTITSTGKGWPGLEAILGFSGKNPDWSAALRERWIRNSTTETVTGATQSYNSRDSTHHVSLNVSVPEIGEYNGSAELGYKTLDSMGQSGQGNWSQGLFYGRLEAGKNFDNVPGVGRLPANVFVQYDRVTNQPIPFVNSSAVTYGIGTTVNFTMGGNPKKSK